ncbi:MAG: YdcF family protein [Verrucomicrobia bacterium]|nr:YdcF family protein [Verrucomicrobiota bacterium]
MKQIIWLRLVQCRTIWWPTWVGWLCILLLLVIPVVWWCICAESFLSLTRRLPAEVLVVEGWIGDDGIRASAGEFERHRYQYIVASGGPSFDRWDEGHLSYAEMAERELIRAGVPKDRIIVAPARDADHQRTYVSALAVSRALEARAIQPKRLNLFTLGAHARRSRLIFAKALRSGTDVGVISWVPYCNAAVPWWRSSERAKNLITETVGYMFEILLNSGRGFDSPGKGSDFAELRSQGTKGAAPQPPRHLSAPWSSDWSSLSARLIFT